jgi:hypothetical protein
MTIILNVQPQTTRIFDEPDIHSMRKSIVSVLNQLDQRNEIVRDKFGPQGRKDTGVKLPVDSLRRVFLLGCHFLLEPSPKSVRQIVGLRFAFPNHPYFPAGFP